MAEVQSYNNFALQYFKPVKHLGIGGNTRNTNRDKSMIRVSSPLLCRSDVPGKRQRWHLHANHINIFHEREPKEIFPVRAHVDYKEQGQSQESSLKCALARHPGPEGGSLVLYSASVWLDCKFENIRRTIQKLQSQSIFRCIGCSSQS